MSEQFAPLDFSEASPEEKKAQLDQDRQQAEDMNDFTSALVKGLEEVKKVDEFYAQSNYKDRFQSV